MKNFFKFLIFLIVVATILGVIAAALLGGFQKFAVHSCGSGLYFNRSAKLTYTIKELGLKFTGNYFYHEDYFYSEELGTEYTVKGRIFDVGSVYLAKKTDHYNPVVYSFNVLDYNNRVIKITSDMNYVELISTNPDETVNVYIQIEDRELPLDLTLNNVNITTSYGLPVIFSRAFADINLILKGKNTLIAGSQNYDLQSIVEHLKGVLSEQEQAYYKAIEEIDYAKDTLSGKNSAGDAAYHYFEKINNVTTAYIDGFLNGINSLLSGKDGNRGVDGSSAILHPMGISVSGDGTLYAKGGAGGNGGDASGSLFGHADGGDGGNGGSGISCANFLDMNGNLTLEAGAGGNGGNAKKGLIGANGNGGHDGIRGTEGTPLDVSNPRRED